MNWELFSIVPAIFLGIFIIVLLWGVGRAWKAGSKFISLILLATAAAVAIGFYALYGKRFFG